MFKSKTAIRTYWVVASSLGSKFFGFVSILILTRNMSPEHFGIYSVSLSILSIALELSDLGQNASATRYAAEFFAKDDTPSLRKIFSIMLRTRLITGLLVATVGISLSKIIATHGFAKPEVAPYLKIAFFGALFSLTLTLLNSFLQAQQKFERYAVSNFSLGLAQIIPILILWWVGFLTPKTALWAYGLAPLLPIVIVTVFLPKNILTLRDWDSDIARRLFHYGKWMILWAVAVMIQSRLDILMLTRMTTLTEVGLYQAAFKVASVANIVPSSFSAVAAPKLYQLHAEGNLTKGMKNVALVAAGMAFLFLAAAIPASWLAPWILGSRYAGTGPLFSIFLVGWALLTLNLPLGIALSAIEKPKVITLAACLALVQSFVMNLVLIPRYGAIGAAWTFASSGVVFVITCSAGILYYRKKGLLEKNP